MKPCIAVIVPVYNTAPYLHTCLGSLRGQTLHDVEIICVNDGSTDACGEILRDYAAQDGRIRVLTQPNSGLGAARNAGLAVATAPYIMFCDSDDWYAPTMCEKMYRAIAVDDSVDFAQCEWQCAYSEVRLVSGGSVHFRAGKFSLTQELLAAFRGRVILHNTIFRHSVISRYGVRFLTDCLLEDQFFFMCYAMHSACVFFLPERLYFYRRREGSIMSNFCTGQGRAEHYLNVAAAVWQYAQRNCLLVQWRRSLIFFLWSMLAEAIDLPLLRSQRRGLLCRGIRFSEKVGISLHELPPVALTAMARIFRMHEHRWLGRFLRCDFSWNSFSVKCGCVSFFNRTFLPLQEAVGRASTKYGGGYIVRRTLRSRRRYAARLRRANEKTDVYEQALQGVSDGSGGG